MPNTFSRTFRSLDADPGGKSRAAMLGAMLVLCAWGAWFALAHLSVYATSESARLEVTRATHPVDAPLAGRVVSVNLALDQMVHEGDVLVQLDDQGETLALAEAKAKASGLGPQLDATRAQIDAEHKAMGDLSGQSRAAAGEQAARVREAHAATLLAREEASRVERLHASGSIPDIEWIRARSNAEKTAAAESALTSSLVKLKRQFSTDGDDRLTRVAALDRDASKLEAELRAIQATIDTLTHEIDRRRVVAPATGRIGEVGTVRAGTVLKEGDRIGTIVSTGELRVVAQLVPADALGRVHAGQTARVRFDGFPWTEYGEVTAEVTDVAREVRDGHARVELAIVKASPRIPLEHGLPGSVQIEIERATPAQLVLRAAGKLVSRARPEPAPARPGGGA
ncbi:MAG TPA: HlyD family efflux transporter periplasmic adaptor subunit [Polyangiaceae bacterium]|jgi:membrane fusion protein (multidrug efflux system)